MSSVIGCAMPSIRNYDEKAGPVNIFFRTFVTAALVASISFPVFAAVGGIEGPWSILVAGEIPPLVTDGYFVPLLVSSLDGRSPTTYSVATQPGKKQILLDTPRTANDRGPSYKRLELDMEPCMRYFVAGKKSSSGSLRWTPEVFKVEPIGECAAEFNLTNKPNPSTMSAPSATN